MTPCSVLGLGCCPLLNLPPFYYNSPRWLIYDTSLPLLSLSGCSWCSFLTKVPLCQREGILRELRAWLSCPCPLRSPKTRNGSDDPGVNGEPWGLTLHLSKGWAEGASFCLALKSTSYFESQIWDLLESLSAPFHLRAWLSSDLEVLPWEFWPCFYSPQGSPGFPWLFIYHYGGGAWWFSHSAVSKYCNPMDCGLPGSSVHGIL